MSYGRRPVGAAGLMRHTQAKAAVEKVSAQVVGDEMKHLETQMGLFKASLEEFARVHKAAINRDPEFRRQFQQMTTSIGVDPLASNKGFWAEVLGMGDFYYELGVQIVDVCMKTRAINGGLIDVQDLLSRLALSRGSKLAAVGLDDVERAIKKMSVLGNGFRMMNLGSRKLIVSVPYELNVDHTQVLAAAEATGYVTASMLKSSLRWDNDRVSRALSSLLREGMAWVDSPASASVDPSAAPVAAAAGGGAGGSAAASPLREPLYWFPSIRIGT